MDKDDYTLWLIEQMSDDEIAEQEYYDMLDYDYQMSSSYAELDFDDLPFGVV